MDGGNEPESVSTSTCTREGNRRSLHGSTLRFVDQRDPRSLLLQDGFGEVARLVHVDPGLNG
jgi:hypothetical protein